MRPPRKNRIPAMKIPFFVTTYVMTEASKSIEKMPMRMRLDLNRGFVSPGTRVEY